MAVRTRKETVDKLLQIKDEEQEKLTGKYAVPFSSCKTSTNSVLEHTTHGVVLKLITKPNIF